MSNDEIVVNTLCLNCFHKGHDEEECSKFGVYACINCYRFNVATSACNCNNRKQDSSPQLTRLVGDHIGPYWYIDIKIFDKIVPAMINTSIKRCRINQDLAFWIQSCSNAEINDDAEIRVPIQRKGTTYEIRCQVFESESEVMEVGTAFLKYFGFRFTFDFDGVTISSQDSFIASHPSEVEYVYNIPAIGKDLRELLNQKKKFLRKGRVAKPSNWPPKSNGSDRIVIIRRTKPATQNEQSD